MTDYLVSPLKCLTSQTYCNSSHCTLVSILIMIPVRFGASSQGLDSVLYPNEVFARRDTKCRPRKRIQMELWHQTQYGEGQDSQLEGLVGTPARSALAHVESQQSVLLSWIIHVQVVLYSALMPSQLSHQNLLRMYWIILHICTRSSLLELPIHKLMYVKTSSLLQTLE